MMEIDFVDLFTVLYLILLYYHLKKTDEVENKL